MARTGILPKSRSSFEHYSSSDSLRESVGIFAAGFSFLSFATLESISVLFAHAYKAFIAATTTKVTKTTPAKAVAQYAGDLNTSSSPAEGQSKARRTNSRKLPNAPTTNKLRRVRNVLRSGFIGRVSPTAGLDIFGSNVQSTPQHLPSNRGQSRCNRVSFSMTWIDPSPSRFYRRMRIRNTTQPESDHRREGENSSRPVALDVNCRPR